ncbi:THAP domain-containing protein 6-like [Diretmus argenteus]
MPDYCAAFGCSLIRSRENRQKGITFHRFPKDALIRKAWTIAVRREDFKPGNRAVLCSCHFKLDDFDRTGQTVRLKEGVIPSVFPAFPDHLNKLPDKARSTRTSTQASEASDHVPVCDYPEQLNPSTLDHHYALDPDQVKQKLTETQRRAEELQRQLRNAKDRDRRSKTTVKALLDELREKNMISEELQLKLDHYSDKHSCTSVPDFDLPKMAATLTYRRNGPKP